MNGMTQTKYDQTDALKTRPIRSMFPQSMDPHVQAKNSALYKSKMEKLIVSQQKMAREKARMVTTEKNLQRNVQLKDRSNEYPQFTRNEFVFGPMLGTGSFCTVFEIIAVMTRASDGKPVHSSLPPALVGDGPSTINKSDEKKKLSSSTPNEKTLSAGQKEEEQHATDMDDDVKEQSRLFIGQNCRRKTGESRYAIKKISPESTRDPSHFTQAMIDMATETRLLSSLGRHPNIIKLRAVSAGYDPFDEQSFIVLDRLYDTLEERIQTWQAKNLRDKVLFLGAGSRRRKRLDQQLLAAHDLASALAYLHRHRVIHRDLKPQNVGYNIRDDLVLFDFGLARELVNSSEADDDGLFCMTGFIGSYRYMAPEVGKKLRYNEKSDVYGFAILCWEIFSLKKSFMGHSVGTLKTKVWDGPYLRPNTLGKDGTDLSGTKATIVNESVNNMIERAWSHDIASRPTMDEILVTLKEECLDTNIDVSMPSGLALHKASSDFDTTSKRQRSFKKRRSTNIFEPCNVIDDS